MHPCCASSPLLAEPNRSSGCRERSPQPAWSTQTAAGRQTHFDEKRLSRSWDPTIQQLPGWLCLARGESHSTGLCWNQQPPGSVSNPVIQPGAASPLLHLQLLLGAGQSPTVLSESEEQRFHSWPFEQQQLFCLCCQAINAGSPPHPPPALGLEQLPAAQIRLPGCYLSQARVFSAGE